jgi:carboxypeptidase Taq
MDSATEKALKYVSKTLDRMELYAHACHIINYDQETICPKQGLEDEGLVNSFLSNLAFRLSKDKKFIADGELLFAKKEELSYPDRVLAEQLHRNYLKTKNITPEMDKEFSEIRNKSFVDWLSAKQKSDFSLFAPSLKKVIEMQKKDVSLREVKAKTPYEEMLGDYERGITIEDLDKFFGEVKMRLLPLLKKIEASPKKVRTDFLSRRVSVERQKYFTDYLMNLIGFDLSRGACTTTEHPFTDIMGRYDTRITTHYYEDNFVSNMFSVIHEGGHAIFEQNQNPEDWDHHLNESMSMGMHESVSRFFENRIGRSRGFIHLIYPKFQELYGDIFSDVSEEELYEGVNAVQPSLIRTESDEFTYTFHIIIRYELEKAAINDNMPIEQIHQQWNELYYKYLGVRPDCDRTGILQDVHWASGMGYFPTYALGNAYNAMYYNKMSQEIDIDKTVAEGHLDQIVKWMTANVFKKANRLDAKEWIKDITGRPFTSNDFLTYLEEKYSALYEIQ